MYYLTSLYTKNRNNIAIVNVAHLFTVAALHPSNPGNRKHTHDG